jgi:hypothetical protein
VPAVPDPSKGGKFLLIPDRPKPALATWKTTNPLEYSLWFESRTELLVESYKYARAEIEPLRHPESAELKSVLTKAVQLLKRWRDIHFRDDRSLGPPSIILTTLAAQIYSGQRSIVAAMDQILEGLRQLVEAGIREIRNPINDDEVISEKWLAKPATYDAFVAAVADLRSRWDDVGQAVGLPNVTKKLGALFGDAAAARAVKELFGSISPALGANFVRRDTGTILTSVAAPATGAAGLVKSLPHTFHGDA